MLPGPLSVEVIVYEPTTDELEIMALVAVSEIAWGRYARATADVEIHKRAHERAHEKVREAVRRLIHLTGDIR